MYSINKRSKTIVKTVYMLGQIEKVKLQCFLPSKKASAIIKITQYHLLMYC